MRKYHLPIVDLKTDSFKEVLAKLEELGKARPTDTEARLFIRHNEENQVCETPFLGTFADLKKYLEDAVGYTSMNMFASKMRKCINT